MLAPLTLLAPRLEASRDRSMAFTSKPEWFRKFWSSLQTTAKGRFLEISSNDTQSCLRRSSLPPTTCAQQRMIIKGVIGTGINLKITTKAIEMPKNHKPAFHRNRKIFLPRLFSLLSAMAS